MMTFNLIERARKLAKLPAFIRDCPKTETGRITCDQFAEFVGSVRIVWEDAQSDFDDLRIKFNELRDRHEKLLKEHHTMSRKQWARDVGNNVKQVADTIDLPAHDVNRLVDAVESA